MFAIIVWLAHHTGIVLESENKTSTMVTPTGPMATFCRSSRSNFLNLIKSFTITLYATFSPPGQKHVEVGGHLPKW